MLSLSGTDLMRAILLIALLLLPATAQAATYPVEGDMAGAIVEYTVQEKDTLLDIARRFDMGIAEVMSANPDVDPWLPKPGSTVIIPSLHILPALERKGIIINLGALRLYYFPDPHTVMTFPIGIGMDGWTTPTGETKIVRKRERPTWWAPKSILDEDPTLPPFIPPGPENPLGDYAMNLGIPGYLLHGTNKPYGSIGRRSSHGCMRLYPEDIEQLFAAVEVGTPVTIIDVPYQLGWKGNTLYLQAMPSQKQVDQVTGAKPMTLIGLPQIYGDVRHQAGADAAIDWQAIRYAAMWRPALPVAVARKKEE
jgi:L,D-transpeptidase ErfK/SrfK